MVRKEEGAHVETGTYRVDINTVGTVEIAGIGSIVGDLADIAEDTVGDSAEDRAGDMDSSHHWTGRWRQRLWQ